MIKCPEARVTATLHEGWLAGILLALMLLSVTASVATANWADGVWLLPYAAWGGMLFGILLARVRLRGALASFLSLVVGAAWIEYQLSHLVLPASATWNEKVLIIESRIAVWFGKVAGGGIGSDTLIFVLLLCAVGWLIGSSAAWSVFHAHQPWGAILPAGAGLLVNLFYAPPQSGIMLVSYLLCAMLLLVRTTLLKRQETWRRLSIRYANDIGFDFLMYGIVFSALIIFTSWLVPPTAPGPQWVSGITERFRGPWQDLSEGVIRAFSTVRGGESAAPRTFFGQSLALGGPVRLGARPVLDIRAPEGRYWRATVFDKYTGTGWVNTDTATETFSASDPRLMPPPTLMRREISQTVQVLLPSDNLVVAASQPVRVSAPAEVRYWAWRISDGEVYVDIARMRLQKPLRQGDAYEVASSLSAADEDSLRAASTTYPGYIRARYLTLPATVPARVRDLALQITADATNNYDRARAIEDYLRAHIIYDENVMPPPAGRDGVDYVLFDRPAGYCNYYASAMAVLARAVGIPSRVASGYAVGEAINGVYHLLEGNAHSWPELYFGNLGWIEFEPTSGRPAIVRPAEPAAVIETPDETPGDPTNKLRGFGERDLEEERFPRRVRPAPSADFWLSGPEAATAVGAASGLLLFLGTIGAVQWRWHRRVRGLPPAARVWEETFRLAPLLGSRERAPATPYERAAALSALLPDARVGVAEIADAYLREQFGKQTLSADEAIRLRQTLVRLRVRILRGAFARFSDYIPQRASNAVRAWWQRRQAASNHPRAE